MAKTELGTKRLCPNCGAKYYDLGRDPIVCPRCGASFETGVVGVRPETAEARERPAAEDDVENDVEAAKDVEFVSLEEVEAEEKKAAGGEIDEAEIDNDDDGYIEDEDDDSGVADVVGGVDGEDEDR